MPPISFGPTTVTRMYVGAAMVAAAYCDSQTLLTPPVPAAPTIANAPLIVQAVQGSPLTFNVAYGISGYPTPTVVYDAMVAGAVVAAGITSGSYTLPTAGLSLTVRATATNASGSTTSTSIPVTVAAPAATVPGQVTGLTIGAVTDTTQALTFTAPSNGGAAISDYVIQWANAGSGVWNTFADGVGTGLSITVTGLIPSSPYDYRVAAVNGVGQGAYSAMATNTTAATPTTITNPRYALVGDSLTMYANAGATILSTNTLTRDAAGLVTCVTAGHGLAFPGQHKLSFVNLQDKTFEGVFLATAVNATTLTYQTSVLGLATTTAGDASGFGRALFMGQLMQNGYWDWFNSFCKGGARNRGNFGQGADRLDQMIDAVTKACLTDAEVIKLQGGINDIFGGADGSTVTARMQVLVNIVKSYGKKYSIIGMTPLGAALNTLASRNVAIQSGNAGYAGIVASDPGIGVFSSAYNDLTDGANNGEAYAWVAGDGVHWGERAAYWVGYRDFQAEQSRITLNNLLPTTSTDTPTLNGYTLIKQYGAWSATGGGFAGTGVTGTVAPNLQIFSSATLPAVASLVDRGGTDGFFQQLVLTPSAASQQITVYLGPNGGQTLAALGLAVGDTVKLVAEVVVSNGVASSMLGVALTSNSQSSGTLGKTVDGGFLSQALIADNYSRLCVAEEWIIGSSVTSVINFLSMRFGTLTGAPCTFSLGKAALYKKTGTT